MALREKLNTIVEEIFSLPVILALLKEVLKDDYSMGTVQAAFIDAILKIEEGHNPQEGV